MWLWGSGRGEPERLRPTSLLAGGMGTDLVRVTGAAIPIPPPSAEPSKRPRAMERHEVVIHHRDFNDT